MGDEGKVLYHTKTMEIIYTTLSFFVQQFAILFLVILAEGYILLVIDVAHSYEQV